MSTQDNFPNIKPSLLLDFANVKQLDPRITFTRASTGSYFDRNGVLQSAASGVARFGHNPTTGESLGLLVEEQRANLLTYSEQFDNAGWTKDQLSVLANQVVAPDGTLSGDKLVENTASALRSIRQPVTGLASGATLTWSFYAKAGERTTCNGYINDNATTVNRVQASFDLAAGTTSSPTNFGTFTGATSTITPVGNGWYRCTLTGVATGVTAVQARIFIGTTSYTGDGYSGLYVWGAQLEAGAFPTSYIPTVASQVTRAADAASMTGANFSSWYRADEGTLFCKTTPISAPSSSVSGGIVSIADGSNNNRIQLGFGTGIGGNANMAVTSGGVLQANPFVGALGTNATRKIAGVYQTNSFQIAVGGSLGVEDTSGILPVVTLLNIGASGNPNAFLNGHIRKIAFYPKRLTNTELQGLTS